MRKNKSSVTPRIRMLAAGLCLLAALPGCAGWNASGPRAPELVEREVPFGNRPTTVAGVPQIEMLDSRPQQDTPCQSDRAGRDSLLLTLSDPESEGARKIPPWKMSGPVCEAAAVLVEIIDVWNTLRWLDEGERRVRDIRR